MDVDKKISSVDDDDDMDLKSFSKYLQEDTQRNKNNIADEFTEIGEELLAEIDDKNKRKEAQKNKHITYILRHSNKYSVRQLCSYSYIDVINIYNEIKTKGTFLQRIFRFIFNL